MTKVLAGITTSVDGYITGPDDGPGKGLGEDGERLHYWVFGGPWTYESESKGEPTGEDAAWLAGMVSRVRAAVGGRHLHRLPGQAPMTLSRVKRRGSRAGTAPAQARAAR